MNFSDHSSLSESKEFPRKVEVGTISVSKCSAHGVGIMVDGVSANWSVTGHPLLHGKLKSLYHGYKIFWVMCSSMPLHHLCGCASRAI